MRRRGPPRSAPPLPTSPSRPGGPTSRDARPPRRRALIRLPERVCGTRPRSRAGCAIVQVGEHAQIARVGDQPPSAEERGTYHARLSLDAAILAAIEVPTRWGWMVNVSYRRQTLPGLPG